MPGLAAGDEPDEVKNDRGGEDPEGRKAERGAEVVALAPETKHERAAHDQAAGDGRGCGVTAEHLGKRLPSGAR
jgi:hypothetical protein